LAPQIPLGSLQRSPRSPSCISGGLLLKGRGGRGRDKRKGREGKEEEEGKGGEGRGERPYTPLSQIPGYATAVKSAN